VLYNKLCYNKICLLNVHIVAKRQKLNGRQRNSVLTVVSNASYSINLRNVHADSVARFFRWSINQITIVSIVLNHVPKKRILKGLSLGTNLILKLWRVIIKTDWRRTLGLGEKSITQNGLKLSAYWGANV